MNLIEDFNEILLLGTFDQAFYEGKYSKPRRVLLAFLSYFFLYHNIERVNYE